MTRLSTIRQVIGPADWLLLSFAEAGGGAVTSAGDGVIAVDQVTYYRQLKGYEPDQRVVVWTDFRHKENGFTCFATRILVNSSYIDSSRSKTNPNAEHR